MQEKVRKAYVEVGAHFDTAGHLRPLWIVWEDGRKFPIDRITDIRRAASLKAGGAGIRYTCMVSGRSCMIFYEGRGRWFVEARCG